MSTLTLKTALLFVVAVGAIVCCAFPFTRIGRSAPRWVGRALVVAGVCLLAESAFSFLLLAQTIDLSATTQRWLYETKARLGALSIGVLVTIFISGQLSKRSVSAQDSKAGSP
jgi:hypothetical protein